MGEVETVRKRRVGGLAMEMPGLPVVVLSLSQVILCIATWSQRHGGWIPFVLCRGSIFMLVSLAMNKRLRGWVDSLPERLLQKGADPNPTTETWERGLPLKQITEYNWDDDGEHVRLRVKFEG